MSGAYRDEDPALARWCRCAVTYIRSKEDRREVYRELYGHMEDRLEDLMDAGMSRKDAEAMTVRAMGDFNETGRALAKLYKPLWGRLLAASRAVFIVTAIFAAAIALEFGGWIWDAGEGPDGMPWDTAAEGIVYPECRDRSDGYVITVPRAVRTGGGAYFTMNFKKPWPWTKEPDTSGFYAVDSKGVMYESARYDRALPDAYLDLRSTQNSFSGALTCSFEGFIKGIENAEWFELRYSRDGRDVRLRVDLEGEE